MMHVGFIILGLVVSFVFPGIGFGGAVLVGALCGLADQLQRAIWPAAKPTFVDPVNRPRPLRNGHHLVGALLVATIGILPFLIAYWAPSPVQLPWRLYGSFLGGMAEGAAVGILLTGARVRESHNRWLAAMSPKSLGAEQ